MLDAFRPNTTGLGSVQRHSADTLVDKSLLVNLAGTAYVSRIGLFMCLVMIYERLIAWRKSFCKSRSSRFGLQRDLQYDL